jgi:hypothetical protein
MTEPKAIDAVMRNFKWFNEVMAIPGHVISREEVERGFTSDARMVANGQLKCAGIEAHVEHFKELQKKLKSLRVRLPLEESITNANECAAYYKIDYVMADGTSGIVHDSALWRVQDGKVALMVETAAFEGPEIPMENHK